ncbi:MAG: L,D-transpeptidase [Lachnospiraceae bacterium]|nr:L,D-transpeptidase [Lachnospiraceae bacterium]
MIILNRNLIHTSKYILKLDRINSKLCVFEQLANEEIRKYYSLKSDYKLDGFAGFSLIKEFSCIFGGSKTPSPEGIFCILDKSHDEYVSSYYGDEPVKFFGYFVIFEDYFIHSGLYTREADKTDFEAESKDKQIGANDSSTHGCIRVSKSDLLWLLNNIEIGTIVIL